MLKASIIIPTYNKYARLVLTLWALGRQQLAADEYEVIIVDDGSTDATPQVLAQLDHANWRWIHQNGQGRAAARNNGIRLARAPILIFLDDDILVRPDFITAHLAMHRVMQPCAVHGTLYDLPYLRYVADPQTGTLIDEVAQRRSLQQIVGPALTTAALAADFEGMIAGHRPRRNFLEEAIRRILCDPIPPIAPWLACVGANFSLPCELFDAVGLFDERFGRTWGCEDLELGYRLHQHGYQIVAAEHAVGYHMTHYRATPFDEHRTAHEYFYQKHPVPAVKHLQAFLEGHLPSLETYRQAVAKDEGSSGLHDS